MAKSSKKATRKFEKNHLSDALVRRKDGQKIKQKLQIKEKKALRAKEHAEFGVGKVATDGKMVEEKKADPLAAMTVDDFFEGGFEIPEKLKSVKKATGKRKRDTPKEDDGSSSDESYEEAPVASDSEGEDDDEDMGMSKEAMEALAEKDPEFYKYLKENDPETLAFDEDDDLAAVDDLSNDEEEQPKKKAKKSKKKKGKKDEVEEMELDSEADEADVPEGRADGLIDEKEVSHAMVQKWKKAMEEQHSLRAMRQVVLAFRAAAHVNEDEGKDYKYTISDPEVYHALLVVTLQLVPKVLMHHLPVKESAAGKVRVSTDNKKFKTLTPLLKSHTASVQHLLESLSDEASLKLTLSTINPLLPYLLPFKKVLKGIVKTVVDIWSDASSTEVVRITAFLVVRRLAVIGDAGLREAVLKTVYQGLIKGARNTTMHTIQGINLMKNSAASLWGIDQTVGYTTGFTFIRQLAIHLRGSITNNSKESYKTVYNWQYVHSLDFWSCVLAEHCSPLKEAEAGKESQLRALIYPTVQVTLGAMRLIPTATYFPLRFHMMRSLLRLSRATGTYIPLAPSILEVLNSAEMKKPPKPSTLKSLDFSTNYKAQKSYLRTRVYQDGVGEQVAELLSEFFVLWSTNVAFPELALPVIVMLKRWLKDAQNKTSGNKNSKINSMLILVVQKLEANSKFIEEKRQKVDFAPNNRAGVESFLKGFEWEKTPLGAYVVGQRKQREQKAKVLEEARRQDDEKKKERRTNEAEDAMEVDDESDYVESD